MELSGGGRVAGPFVSVRSGVVRGGTVLCACVVVVVVGVSLLLDVVWMVGVDPAQHQLPTQGGKARNRDIRNRGALHTAGVRLGGR